MRDNPLPGADRKNRGVLSHCAAATDADAITWTNYHRDYSESFAQAKGKYVSTLAAADTCYKFGCVGSDATARCYGLVCGPHGKYSGGLTVVNNFEQYMHPGRCTCEVL